MKIVLIVAMANNRVIGHEGVMPWHLPEDLKRFKEITMGHPILMGRKTHEAIGRPLPGRQNLILSRDLDFRSPGCQVIHQPQEAMNSDPDAKCLFVIGGAEIYRLFLPYTHSIELTLIHRDFNGDTFFPALDPAEWLETNRSARRQAEGLDFSWSYLSLERSSCRDHSPDLPPLL